MNNGDKQMPDHVNVFKEVTNFFFFYVTTKTSTKYFTLLNVGRTSYRVHYARRKATNIYGYCTRYQFVQR